MMGVIITSFMEFVNDRYSEQSKNALQDAIGDRKFLATQNYPDSTVVSLIDKVAGTEGKSIDDVLIDYGEYFITVFAQKNYSTLFAMQPDTKSFLLAIDMVHKAATQLLSDEATPPSFDYEEENTEGRLVMKYSSNRKLCSLVKGLINGVAMHYNERVSINETQCMKHGADHCRIEITIGE